MTPEQEQHITSSAAVPSVPTVVARFLDITHDPSFSYAELSKALSAEPGIVAEILRLTNSALFGLARKVTSLQQAMTLLGAKRVRTLVLGRYLADSIARKATPGFDTDYFWQRSLTSAVLAARFADKVCPRDRDEVFVAAMLADIGIPVLAAVYPDAYWPMLAAYKPDKPGPTDDQERQAVSVTHGEASAAVMRHWRLPDHLCDAVDGRSSTDHTVAEQRVECYHALVEAAGRVSAILCNTQLPDAPSDVCSAALTGTAMTLDDVRSALDSADADIEEIADVLKLGVRSTVRCSELAASLQDAISVS